MVFIIWKLYTILTYLAVTTYCSSWPQLIYDAIHQELLQHGANFGYPAFTCLTQRWQGRPLLWFPPPGSDSRTLRSRLELLMRITWPSQRRRFILICFTTSMSSYISCSSWFQRILYRRRVHKSYVGFYFRIRLMFAHLKMSRSLHQIIRPAIWATYISKPSFSNRYQLIHNLKIVAIYLNGYSYASIIGCWQ